MVKVDAFLPTAILMQVSGLTVKEQAKEAISTRTVEGTKARFGIASRTDLGNLLARLLSISESSRKGNTTALGNYMSLMGFTKDSSSKTKSTVQVDLSTQRQMFSMKVYGKTIRKMDKGS